MAIISNTPTPSQVMGQNITNPVAQSLQRLTQMQLQNIENQKQRGDMVAGLSALMPKEQAEAVSHLPTPLLNTFLRSSMLGDKTDSKAPTRMNTLMKMKGSIYGKYLQDPEGVMSDLEQAEGMSDIEKRILTTNKIDDEIYQYFLMNSLGRNGQPDSEKASKLARRFGFGG